MSSRGVSSAVQLPPFQTLLDAHGRDVHRFLLATVGHGDADDCYQETWLAALRAYPRLRDASNLRSWILTVAHHKGQPVAVADVPDRAQSLPDPAVENQSDLWTHVRNLPAKQRTAVALRFIADAGYADISAVMGTSEEAARRNVHEGLKRLRMEYQP